MRITYPAGATPLDLDETAGLIPTGISLRVDLDALEQANIAAGRAWALRRHHRDILTISFIQRLHRKMFERVWRWAGHFRLSNKNIGVTAHQIAVQVQQLCDNAAYWVEHGTYPWVELGARFHHQLVSIHPFPNGNGRHARLMADVLFFQHGQEALTWGAVSIDNDGAARQRYIESLRAADRGDPKPLIEFITT